MKPMQGEITLGAGSGYAILNRKWVHVALQVLMIVAFSALTALAKKVSPGMGVPGSSGVLWIGALVIGRSTVRWTGAGTLIGAGVAVWGLPLGLGHSFGYDIALYTCAGLFLDFMARIPGVNILNPVGAGACGLVSHVAKFGFIVYSTYFASVSRHFLVVGLLKSALLHAAFGIAGGLLGWLAVRGAKKGRAWFSRRQAARLNA
jgi:hypothetical protein